MENKKKTANIIGVVVGAAFGIFLYYDFLTMRANASDGTGITLFFILFDPLKLLGGFGIGFGTTRAIVARIMWTKDELLFKSECLKYNWMSLLFIFVGVGLILTELLLQ